MFVVGKDKLGKWLAFQSVVCVFLSIEKNGICGQCPTMLFVVCYLAMMP